MSLDTYGVFRQHAVNLLMRTSSGAIICHARRPASFFTNGSILRVTFSFSFFLFSKSIYYVSHTVLDQTALAFFFRAAKLPAFTKSLP